VTPGTQSRQPARKISNGCQRSSWQPRVSSKDTPPESVLNETTTLEVLEKAQREGHRWVAFADDSPVGFAHVEVIEPGAVHLEEIDVHPDHGRRGLGTKLIRHVCHWAASHGFEAVTLTTFRDVQWNLPFYCRLGFEVVPSEHVSVPLRAIVEDETRRGLDPSRRVVMKRPGPPQSDHLN